MITTILVILAAIISFILGHYFGSFALKAVHNMLGKPYMRTIFTGTKDGSMSIDSHFNNMFIYELDRQYSQIPSDMYNPMADDNEKIAIYLYDVMNSIADNYLPPEKPNMIDDIAEDVPPLGYRGGEEVKQVVDLSDISSKTISNNGIDIEEG